MPNTNTKEVKIQSPDHYPKKKLLNLKESSRPEINYTLPSKYKYLRKKHPSVVEDGALPITSLGLEKNDPNFTIWKKIYLLFGLIFLVIPRTILFILILLNMQIWTYLGTFTIPESEKLMAKKPDIRSGKGTENLFRKTCLWITLFYYRLIFVCFGVYWVNEKGIRAKFKQAPIAVCAPHVTMADTSFFGAFPFHNPVSPVSTDEFGPLLNRPMRLLNAILVSTTSKKSRSLVSQEITRRVSSMKKEDWNQIVVFPEATCTSGDILMNFKTGAFMDGQAVQPIYIESYNYINCTFTWIGYNSPLLFLILLASFRTKITVHYLPIYHPNSQEISDPELFAYNVREVISKYSGLPVLDTDTTDGKIMKIYQNKFGGNPQHAFIGVLDIIRKYNVGVGEILRICEEVMGIFEKNCDGNGLVKNTCDQLADFGLQKDDILTTESDNKFLNMRSIVDAKIKRAF